MAWAGCGADEYAILISARGETATALGEGTTIDVTVRDLTSPLRVESPRTPLDADAVDAEGNPTPIRIGIKLHGPGQFMVHVVARGADGLFAATRCFTVTGVTKADVILVGPLGAELDPDGDSWTEAESCHETGVDAIGCRDQCPTQWGTDCDPENADTNPSAVERCEDDLDQDCDGVDAPCADADGDSYTGCAPDATDTSLCDCDDTNAAVNPGVTESSRPEDGLCENDADDDCDGNDTRCDRDGDGVTSCAEGEPDCDCNDNDASVHPGASETPGGVCDGVDNNCNELTDEVGACLAPDLDADGSPADCETDPSPPPACEDDCNDCSAAMSPLGQGVCGNRIDEDCSLGGQNDGSRLPDGADACSADDADGDGSIGQTAGGPDCADDDATRYPGALDRCGDGIDADCSGTDSSCDDDQDGDGYAGVNDCDDSAANVHPGVADPCNAVDDDCDGVVNEDVDEGLGCILVQGSWTLVDFQIDLLHCGSCRANCNPRCDAGTLCQADRCEGGLCSCAGGAPCGGADTNFCCSDGCQDLSSDIHNCGGCGVECPEPPCQTAVCNDGQCGTVNHRDGEDCGGGRFCCGGSCAGECDPEGPVFEEVCDASCGRHRRTCQADDCQWGPYGACTGQGACSFVNLDRESRGCGLCGSQERVCEADCDWSDWAACTGEGECAPGSIENRGCGDCGSQSRTCRDDCSWGAWGACGGEGVCTPGTDSSQGCGNCGTQTRTCSGTCQWGAYGACGGEGPCATGATSSRGCGNCGTQSRTCNGSCQWGAYGGCGNEGACAPGTSSSQGCGNCGTQSRTCDNACQWGGFGGCGGEGVCSTGATQSIACGNCGDQSQTCDASCNWANDGSCNNQGCTPGTTQQIACNECGNQQQDCDGGCGWADVGSCDNTPARPVCSDGDLCTADSCGATGNCAHNACSGGTPNCCGAAIGCRQCCNAGQCTGNPGLCRVWSCNGSGTCIAVNASNGTACGGGNVCCGGACVDCCGADTTPCGAAATCTDWTCSSNVCTPAFPDNGGDPESECPGSDVCCGGACQTCCGAAGTDPFNNCTGTQCCDGAGTCVAGAC